MTETKISYLEKIIDKINTYKNPDLIKIKYYPYYDILSDCQIKFTNINNTQIKKLFNDNTKEGKYIEYGIKDTFARIEDNDTKYFRKETHAFTDPDYKGIFIFDFYNNCSEDDFPNVVDYHHIISYNYKTVKINELEYSIIETKDNKHNTKGESFNIGYDINLKNINKSLDSFFTLLNESKKKKIIT